MRLYVIAGIIGAVLAVGAWVFYQGQRSGELDRTRDTIETRQEIDDAQADCAGRPWAERLLGDCD